jgi:hypothetical protein
MDAIDWCLGRNSLSRCECHSLFSRFGITDRCLDQCTIDLIITSSLFSLGLFVVVDVRLESGVEQRPGNNCDDDHHHHHHLSTSSSELFVLWSVEIFLVVYGSGIVGID